MVYREKEEEKGNGGYMLVRTPYIVSELIWTFKVGGFLRPSIALKTFKKILTHASDLLSCDAKYVFKRKIGLDRKKLQQGRPARGGGGK